MSSQTSGISGRDGVGFVEQEENSNLDLFGKEPSSSEWTDEKHSLYLKSMEASFVHQLYNSLESSGLRACKKQHSHSGSFNRADSRPTGQFKVHKNGSWERINVGRGRPPTQQSDDCQILLSNPWVKHFRARARENKAVTEGASNESQAMRCGGRIMYTCGLGNITEQSSGIQAYQNSNNTEYSGQNFDEDDNGGGGGQVA